MAFTYGTVWSTGVPGNSTNMNKDLCGIGDAISDFPTAAPYTSTSTPGNDGMTAFNISTQNLMRSTGTTWQTIGSALPSTGSAGWFLQYQGSGASPAWAQAVGVTTQASTSHILDTIYQNTTSKPIFVCASIQSTNQGAGLWKIYTNSTTPPTVVVSDVTPQVVNAKIASTFIVLPSNYYMISTAYATLLNWVEWN